MCVLLRLRTLSWYIFPVAFERYTETSAWVVPNLSPKISRLPLRPGLADVGLRKVIVGAVADPSVYVKLREVSVKAPTLTVTVFAPVVPQEGTKKSALILLTDLIVAFLEQISMLI